MIPAQVIELGVEGGEKFYAKLHFQPMQRTSPFPDPTVLLTLGSDTSETRWSCDPVPITTKGQVDRLILALQEMSSVLPDSDNDRIPTPPRYTAAYAMERAFDALREANLHATNLPTDTRTEQLAIVADGYRELFESLSRVETARERMTLERKRRG